jgi:multicomponent Na+:H+ antiporter subunit D
MQGAIMHVVYHAIVKALLFMVVGIIIEVTRRRQIDNIGGLGAKYKILCVCAAIGVLGISGMPPLGIFNSEWMIFAGGFDSGISTALTVATLIGSLLTVVYALRFFGVVFIGKTQQDDLPNRTPISLLIPTVAVTIFLIVEGLIPGPLLRWATLGLEKIFGGVL